MNHRGIFYRILLIAVLSVAVGFAFGYERGTNDAKDFVFERIGK